MIFYHVLTKQDEVVKCDKDWIKKIYTPMECPKCKNLHPRHCFFRIDVTILEIPEGPNAILKFPVQISLIRRDFREVLRECMEPLYHFGDVYFGGKKVPNYSSVVCSNEGRVLVRGDETSEYKICPACGRYASCMAVGDQWVAHDDVIDKKVFSSSGGGGLYIAAEIVEEIPEYIRKELRLYPIQVK